MLSCCQFQIILTLRDENGWWKSFKRMNDRMFEKPWLRSALLLSPTGYRLGTYANKACKYILYILSSLHCSIHTFFAFALTLWMFTKVVDPEVP